MPADADGVWLFADTTVALEQAPAAEAALRGAASSGSLAASLVAAGLPVTGTSVLYAGVGTPSFPTTVVPSNETTDAAPVTGGIETQAAPAPAPKSSNTGMIVGIAAGVAGALVVVAGAGGGMGSGTAGVEPAAKGRWGSCQCCCAAGVY